jgi:hypothetical protein
MSSFLKSPNVVHHLRAGLARLWRGVQQRCQPWEQYTRPEITTTSGP